MEKLSANLSLTNYVIKISTVTFGVFLILASLNFATAAAIFLTFAILEG